VRRSDLAAERHVRQFDELSHVNLVKIARTVIPWRTRRTTEESRCEGLGGPHHICDVTLAGTHKKDSRAVFLRRCSKALWQFANRLT
jgi:hypothetical protein